jgi:hypothetical protein
MNAKIWGAIAVALLLGACGGKQEEAAPPAVEETPPPATEVAPAPAPEPMTTEPSATDPNAPPPAEETPPPQQ